jgi:hypothetical protein
MVGIVAITAANRGQQTGQLTQACTAYTGAGGARLSRSTARLSSWAFVTNISRGSGRTRYTACLLATAVSSAPTSCVPWTSTDISRATRFSVHAAGAPATASVT